MEEIGCKGELLEENGWSMPKYSSQLSESGKWWLFTKKDQKGG